MFSPSTAATLSMSPVRGPGTLSLSALQLQDAATIAFAAELHAIRWGAGMCVAARIARRFAFEAARRPIISWLSRMASECQCARRACTHISLAVEKMALQVGEQQEVIQQLTRQLVEARPVWTSLSEESKALGCRIMVRWKEAVDSRDLVLGFQQFKSAFIAHNMERTAEAAKKQADDEDNLSRILEECNQIKSRLKAAEETAIENAKLELALTAGIEAQNECQSLNESNASDLMAQLLAAQSRNEELEKSLKQAKAQVKLGILLAHLNFFQVELVTWSVHQWAFGLYREKKYANIKESAGPPTASAVTDNRPEVSKSPVTQAPAAEDVPTAHSAPSETPAAEAEAAAKVETKAEVEAEAEAEADADADAKKPTAEVEAAAEVETKVEVEAEAEAEAVADADAEQPTAEEAPVGAEAAVTEEGPTAEAAGVTAAAEEAPPEEDLYAPILASGTVAGPSTGVAGSEVYAARQQRNLEEAKRIKQMLSKSAAK